MRLFKRTTADEAAIPEDLRPYYSGQTSGFRRWLGPIMRIILLLVLLALLVWAGVSLVNYFAKRNDGATDKNNTPATSQQAQREKDEAAKKAADDKAAKDAAAKKAADEKAAKDAAAKKEAEQKAAAAKAEEERKKQQAAATAPAPSPSAPGGAQTETGTSGGAVATNPPASSGTQSLPNSGPAEVSEVIALFIGTTIVAAVAHRLFVEFKLR
jgi:FtsZ-interacting cell division protein ZipA